MNRMKKVIAIVILAVIMTDHFSTGKDQFPYHGQPAENRRYHFPVWTDPAIKKPFYKQVTDAPLQRNIQAEGQIPGKTFPKVIGRCLGRPWENTAGIPYQYGESIKGLSGAAVIRPAGACETCL